MKGVWDISSSITVTVHWICFWKTNFKTPVFLLFQVPFRLPCLWVSDCCYNPDYPCDVRIHRPKTQRIRKSCGKILFEVSAQIFTYFLLYYKMYTKTLLSIKFSASVIGFFTHLSGITLPFVIVTLLGPFCHTAERYLGCSSYNTDKGIGSLCAFFTCRPKQLVPL